MIKFNLPGFYEHLSLNVNFLEIIKNNKTILSQKLQLCP